MSEPNYTQFTERMYARLPEVMREADTLNDYALKRYISAIGDVEDQVERLIARFTYLSAQDRLGLDRLTDDHSYYDLDWKEFQSTGSYNSAAITTQGVPAYLRTVDAYRIVPSTTIYAGAIFRTDVASADVTYGLRAWYYDASMTLIQTRDLGRNNGSVGPQWVVINATDLTPEGAYYLRLSPFATNSTSAPATVWVDDVYVRSQYEVTTTNNLVSSGHNFTMRAERDLVQVGDFDSVAELEAAADAAEAQAEILYADAPNVLTNSGFEEDLFNWSVSNFGGAGVSTLRSYTGTKSFNDAVGANQVIHRVNYPTSPGRIWELSAWFYIDGTPAGAGQGGARLSYDVNGDNAWIAAPSVNVDKTIIGQWQKVVQRFTVPEVLSPRLRARIAFASMAVPVFIDEVRLVDVTEAVAMEAQAASMRAQAALPMWDRGPGTALVEKSLSGVPDIQAYRTWLALDSTIAEQPGYARQVLTGVEPNATYTVAFLMLSDANAASDASVRVTITPNTGGPVVWSFSVADYERNVPNLLTFTWNSPESVTTAIVNIEHVTTALPAQGLFINDVSVVRYDASVTQMGRIGDPATGTTSERSDTALLTTADHRSGGWIRYATGGDPEDPLGAGDPDLPSGTSFVEPRWHQTRPGNTYVFGGDAFSNDTTAYADLIIWYRTEGKGWGEKLLHRITAAALSTWSHFERVITIPSEATEFRVNLDIYRANASRTFDLRNLSLTPTSNRSWYTAGARPFTFNALATRSLNFLSKGDLLHYTADVMATGTPGYGRFGVRIIAGESQVIHESTVSTSNVDSLTRVTGAFQVPASLMELRAVFYVSDPTPKHQAAYFLSDLQVVHSTQQVAEDPQNLIRNGGFELDRPLDGWILLAEREQVRRNMVTNPIGPAATDIVGWRYAGGDSGTFVTVDGAPALRYNNGVDDTGLYTDSTVNFSPPVGTVIRAQMEVRALVPLTNARIVVSSYYGASTTSQGRTDITLTPEMGWQTLTAESVVTAMPEGGFSRVIFWPTGNYPVGGPFYLRRMIVEYDTTGAYFDKDTPSTALATYSWDSAASAHVENLRTYTLPMSIPMSVGTGPGYNREDVPDRPEDVPLGATSDLVDPRTANTEWLPWLSQFAGHNINHFATLEDARAAFSDTTSNFAAGTIGAIQNAVATVLTGSKTVRVFPMTTDLTDRGGATQWDISIVTRTSESPDISVMEEAVIKRNAKPAGVVFHFHKHQSTWDAVELANPTWNVWDTRTWTGIEEAGLDD